MKATILKSALALLAAVVLPVSAFAGVLSDLVVAPADQAEAIAKATAPSTVFEGVDIKGVNSTMFANLHSLVTGESFERVLPRYEPVVQVGPEGPWVFRIPADVVSRLARLPEAKTIAISKRWAKAEEFARERRPEREALDVLRKISKLARRADESHQALFLWMCL